MKSIGFTHSWSMKPKAFMNLAAQYTESGSFSRIETASTIGKLVIEYQY